LTLSLADLAVLFAVVLSIVGPKPLPRIGEGLALWVRRIKQIL